MLISGKEHVVWELQVQRSRVRCFLMPEVFTEQVKKPMGLV